MLKIGVCTIAFQRETLIKTIEIISSAGGECIEVWSKPPHIIYPVDEGEIKSTRDYAESKNIEIIALGSYINGADRITNNGLEVTIESEIKIAKLLGAKILRVWAGNKNLCDASAEEIKSIAKAINEYSRKAADDGILIVIERHVNTLTNGWWDFPLMLLEWVNHANCRLNYQAPFPVKPGEYFKLIQIDFEKLFPVSGHCHIQNYLNETDFKSRCPLEKGLINYSGLGKTARKCGYRGAFMVEFVPDVPVTEKARALKKDIDFLKTEIKKNK